jgi:hypothetical protein
VRKQRTEFIRFGPKGQSYQSPGRDKTSNTSLVVALGSRTAECARSPNGTALIVEVVLECQSVCPQGQSLIDVDDPNHRIDTLVSFFGMENHERIGLRVRGR